MNYPVVRAEGNKGQYLFYLILITYQLSGNQLFFVVHWLPQVDKDYKEERQQTQEVCVRTTLSLCELVHKN
jgi:hypothetical protein